jgi:hypothetical protein
MPRDVAQAGLYRGSINLWVEDALTREYLSTLWNDSSVLFLVGGGNEGVQAIVKDAEAAGNSERPQCRLDYRIISGPWRNG